MRFRKPATLNPTSSSSGKVSFCQNCENEVNIYVLHYFSFSPQPFGKKMLARRSNSQKISCCFKLATTSERFYFLLPRYGRRLTSSSQFLSLYKRRKIKLDRSCQHQSMDFRKASHCLNFHRIHRSHRSQWRHWWHK